MIIENGPISSLLRKILFDPATTKLLTILFSALLIMETAHRVRHEWNVVSLTVIYCASLIYSVFSLAIVIFKQQDEIGEWSCMKKIFCGRKVYWHEIQTTATFTLAAAQLSTLTIAAAGEVHRQEFHVILSMLNMVCFSTEWYFASKIGKSFVLQENQTLNRNCLEIMLRSFHCCPIFFNVIRKTCLIGAGFFIARRSTIILPFMNFYYFYCTIYAIIASLVLFYFQICQAMKKQNSSTTVSGDKKQTYLMLNITLWAFLAVLSMSLVTGSNRIAVVSSEPHQYNRTEYNNHYNNNNIEKHEQNNDTVGNHTAGSATPQPTTQQTRVVWQPFHAPLIVPVPFALSCIAFVFSFLDLYSRAIRSQSTLNNDDNIVPNNTTDFKIPLQIHDGITKIEDLPIVVASPFHFTDPKKQQFSI